MQQDEARTLVKCCLPRFEEAGLQPLSAESLAAVQCSSIASLWAGMGAVYQLVLECSDKRQPVSIVAKRVELPRVCDSIGDQRKKDSYDVEAAFYARGHAQRLRAAGALVPFPLHVDAGRGEGVTICMTQLAGRSSHRGDSEAFICWLARLHALYWGNTRADEACGKGPKGGLQAQGCYWHLDTRPDEHKRMGSSGWMGRLKLAALAIDLRLKAEPMQSIVHGDAKGANILYASDEAGQAIPLVYDFQYCGKAAVTKDLAYFLNVDAGHAAEGTLLLLYHQELSNLLKAQGDGPPTLDALKVSLELALCDWRRFSEVGLGGWGDGSVTGRVKALLDRLDGGKALASEQAYIDAMKREFPVP